jgi:hypothetical protein
MPIIYRIDHERRLVLSRAVGLFNAAGAFAYQREVWTRPEVTGYDELIDMSAVAEVELHHPDRLRQLAEISSATDPPTLSSRLAIVAPNDLTFGLGRMYQAHRALQSKSTKDVGVFRTLGEAFAFLGVTGTPELPAAN